MGDEKPEPTETSGTVIVEGEPVTVNRETSAADLKDMRGVDPDKTLTYQHNGELDHVNDDDLVLKEVPSGATVGFQELDTDGPMFG